MIVIGLQKRNWKHDVSRICVAATVAASTETVNQPDRCQYMGGGLVQCCRQKDHEDGHRYKCSGKYCPGLGWIASNTPHPTQCTFGPQGTAKKADGWYRVGLGRVVHSMYVDPLNDYFMVSLCGIRRLAAAVRIDASKRKCDSCDAQLLHKEAVQ